MKNIQFFFLALCLFSLSNSFAQTDEKVDPKVIIQQSEDKLQGETSQGEMKMTIVRPTWTREMTLKTWSKGAEQSLILLTGPARDKGAAFLKREKEIWNWQPTIDRVIKLPPSMMMQSWMGSDFTNDDLVQQSSIITDYTHKHIGDEEIEGRNCYIFELIPTEDAAVVWGKVKLWIDKEELIQMKSEFFDEDEYLVNTILAKEVKTFDGKLLPAVLEIIPAEEEGHKTIIEQLSLKFDEKIDDSFFSVQNMKRVR